ncbi:hypothetical protein NDU88_004905 [Pleurodeles waltl]|uniref:Uncharacterized protein n=1 Tax=Pleurodeles waltl TaxID=8319 RepID=A0AAV7MXQ0_PLEWA|nr:hypothetical protein NDU88_004905 [Pleurodeles waltl]
MAVNEVGGNYDWWLGGASEQPAGALVENQDMPTHLILTAHRPGESVSEDDDGNSRREQDAGENLGAAVEGGEDQGTEDQGATAEGGEIQLEEENRSKKPSGHHPHEAPCKFPG